MASKIKELPGVFALEDFRFVPRSFLSGSSWIWVGLCALTPMLCRHVRRALRAEEDGEAVPKNHPDPAENCQQGPVPRPPLGHGARGGQEGSQAIGATAVLCCGTAASQMW